MPILEILPQLVEVSDFYLVIAPSLHIFLTQLFYYLTQIEFSFIMVCSIFSNHANMLVLSFYPHNLLISIIFNVEEYTTRLFIFDTEQKCF